MTKHKPSGKTREEMFSSKNILKFQNEKAKFRENLKEEHGITIGSDVETREEVTPEGRVKKIIKYYKEQPKSDKPIDSLMIVPYISTKTFPDYIRMMIESYDWMPEMVHYVMNDVSKPLYQNKFDWKCVETYKKVKPLKYFIHHASDMYMNPPDLGRFKHILDNDPKAFAVGVYPIGNQMRHSKVFEDFVVPTRIVMWRADLFGKFMEKGIELSRKVFKGGPPLDCVYFMGLLAQRAGYHAVVDAKARPFPVLKDEFKTLWINPDNQPDSV